MEKVKKLRYKGTEYIAYNYKGRSRSFSCNGKTIEECRRKRDNYFSHIRRLIKRATLNK